jgi:hypothetical protein
LFLLKFTRYAVPLRIRLFVETTKPEPALIAVLRRHTDLPISRLREAVTTGSAFVDELPGRTAEFRALVTALLNDLEALGVAWHVEINGRPESQQFLRNTSEMWEQIDQETRDDVERELGEEPNEWPSLPGGVFSWRGTAYRSHSRFFAVLRACPLPTDERRA